VKQHDNLCICAPIVSRKLGMIIIQEFEVKFFSARATRLEYYSASAQIKYGSAWLGHFAAQLMQLQLRLSSRVIALRQKKTQLKSLKTLLSSLARRVTGARITKNSP